MGKMNGPARAALAAISACSYLALWAAQGQAESNACFEAYPRGGLYGKVTRSLKAGDCTCARQLFIEFGRENLDRIDSERAFFDDINYQIFRCEVEISGRGVASGEATVERRVRGLGK